LLDALGASPAEVERGRDALLAPRLEREAPLKPADLTARLLSPLEATLDEIEPLMAPLGPELRRAAQRTRGTARRAIERLTRRYQRALAERDEVTGGRVDRLLAILMPDDEPQERVLSLPYFACRYGARAFLDRVFATLDPLAPEVRDLIL
jgi:hypothetical protein